MRHIERTLSSYDRSTSSKCVAYGLPLGSTAYVGTGIFHESARTFTQGFI